MKSKFILLLLTFIMGCNLFPYEDFRYVPNGLDASILVSYELLNYSTTDITYEVKLASFNYYNDIYYEASSYQVTGPGTVNILQIVGEETITNSTSANVIIVDQSGSYAEIDPHNFRSKMINKFLEEFTAPDKILLGAFASDGSLQTQPIEFAPGGFTSEWNDREFLFELPKETGGNCSMYDAISSAIDKLSTKSEPDKNIIVLVHANDAGSSTSISDLINKAISSDIKIDFILLGPEPSASLIWEINQQANGVMAICPQDLHMVTILHHLHRLIKGTVYTSRLRVSFTPDTGSISSGNVYENQIKIVDGSSGYEFNPVYVKIKIP